MYSGDDYYDDDVTSGMHSIAFLSAFTRKQYIDALALVSEYTRAVLEILDDLDLLELAEEYEI